jgi:hypothetical protein
MPGPAFHMQMLTSGRRWLRIPGVRRPTPGGTVPHVNDARTRAECARLLGGPAKLERAARSGSGRVIDTSSPAQQEFQALLLWSLLSPRRSLRWDAGKGRAFRDLHSYYTWVSPQPEYLAMGWTVAARVARYLLPDLRCDDDGQARCSGIPGLRLAGIAKGSFQLTHLPTGGSWNCTRPAGSAPRSWPAHCAWRAATAPKTGAAARLASGCGSGRN